MDSKQLLFFRITIMCTPIYSANPISISSHPIAVVQWFSHCYFHHQFKRCYCLLPISCGWNYEYDLMYRLLVLWRVNAICASIRILHLNFQSVADRLLSEFHASAFTLVIQKLAHLTIINAQKHLFFTFLTNLLHALSCFLQASFDLCGISDQAFGRSRLFFCTTPFPLWGKYLYTPTHSRLRNRQWIETDSFTIVVPGSFQPNRVIQNKPPSYASSQPMTPNPRRATD